MHLLATGQSRKYDAEQQGALAADVSHAHAETEALIRRVGGGLLYRRPGDSSATLEGNRQDEGSHRMACVDHRTDQGAG